MIPLAVEAALQSLSAWLRAERGPAAPFKSSIIISYRIAYSGAFTYNSLDTSFNCNIAPDVTTMQEGNTLNKRLNLPGGLPGQLLFQPESRQAIGAALATRTRKAKLAG
jgi:hypothetical protein